MQKIPRLAAAGPTRAASWKDKLNPFRAPEPVAPPLTNAVQAELSLESVKVIHNDLADADIEIVPVKSRTAATPEVPMLPPPERLSGTLATVVAAVLHGAHIVRVHDVRPAVEAVAIADAVLAVS